MSYETTRWLLVSLATVIVLAFLLKPSKCSRSHDSVLSVQVIVLGDVGRSPRMQYHAMSLAKHGCNVQLVGYQDTPPFDELAVHDKVNLISIQRLPSYFQASSRLAFLLLGPLKVAFQTGALLASLLYGTRPADWVLVQNPPSIPTLLVAALVCWLRGSKLIVDWHNLGYSILALKLGPSHIFVTASQIYERLCGRLADLNISVSDALAGLLRTQFNIKQPVITLHDRPVALFKPLTVPEEHKFLSQNNVTAPYFDGISSGVIRLVVSSTSWTMDEDFSILLNALCDYSAAAISTHPQLPELLVVITGKGPQREQYLDEVEQLKRKDELEMVDIKSTWLSFEDYSSLLASADLGVSLHTSSSGVDLPMKVVDMFGAGLPVVGYSGFQAWPELVKEDVNGKGFTTHTELAHLLIKLFDPGSVLLDQLRTGALRESEQRWDEEWNSTLGTVLGLS